MTESRKSPWLQEVEDDATHIQTKRFNDYFADQQYKAEKAKAAKKATVKEEVSEPVTEPEAPSTEAKGVKR